MTKHVRAFYPLMIVPGIVLLLAPSTVETVMKYFRFGEALGSLLQVSYFAGGVVGILLITHFMQWLSAKQLVLSMVVLLALALLACSVSPWYPLLLFFYVIAGFANGILITFPGVYVTRVCGESSHHDQSLLYSFFALGVVTSPVLAALIIDNGISWRWAFAAPALLILPLSIPIAVARLEHLEGTIRLSVAVVSKVLDFNRRLFWGLFLALLLYIAAESAVSMWLVTFLKEEHGVGLGAAHWILTALWAGLTVGRLICGWLSKKINPFKIVAFITVMAGLFVLLTPLTGSKIGSMIMYPLVGLFYSGIYPFLVGYVSYFPDDLSPFVFTVYVAAGAASSAVLIFASGLINQFGNLSLGMALIAVPIFGVLMCLYRIKPELYRGSNQGAG